MRINSISQEKSPNFKKMIIVKPEEWQADVLDSFIKNKDIQTLTKDWAKEGKDLSGCFHDGLLEKGVAIFKNLDIVHKINSKTIENLTKGVAEFTRKDIKIAPPRSKDAQDRLDNAVKYVDEFNKSLEKKDEKPSSLKDAGNIAAKPAKRSFWRKIFNM